MKFLRDINLIVDQIYNIILSAPVYKSKGGENYFIHNSTKNYLCIATCNKLYNFDFKYIDKRIFIKSIIL